MSYYRNSFNFCEKSTFQGHSPASVPPPPIPPPFFMTTMHRTPVLSDVDIVKQFEGRLRNVQHKKCQPSIAISKVRDEIRSLALSLNEIKMKEKMLSERIDDLPNEEWSLHLRHIDEHKAIVSEIFSNINNLNTEVLRKLLAKRSSKRIRQKRQREEKKKKKEEILEQNKEKSRKIDEYLQKFQDDINKAKQEEEAKLEADAVLRETIRKKQDAKKYIVKLEALVKLRKARQNTAKGRGEKGSEKEAEVFENNVEKLKSMWKQRLAIYKEEESELRARLALDSTDLTANTNEAEKEVVAHLSQWKETLFGGMLPQVDFAGDVGRFVAVRSQWDQYLSTEGTPIPIGWVPPNGESE